MAKVPGTGFRIFLVRTRATIETTIRITNKIRRRVAAAPARMRKPKTPATKDKADKINAKFFI